MGWLYHFPGDFCLHNLFQKICRFSDRLFLVGSRFDEKFQYMVSKNKMLKMFQKMDFGSFDFKVASEVHGLFHETFVDCRVFQDLELVFYLI